MPWLETVSTYVTAVALGKDIVSSRKALKRHWRRMVFRVRNGGSGLVLPVFGAGGVGKTTYARIIAGTLSPFHSTAPYVQSVSTETIDLHGDVPGVVLIAPGQERRVDMNWPLLTERLQQGHARCLINIVAYGYHATDIDSFRDHKLYSRGMKPVTFLANYTRERRDVEVALLTRLIELIPRCDRPVRMITAVNKQDLWKKDVAAVRDHYENGEYARQVSILAAKLGSSKFQHDFVPVSMQIGNLTTKDGSILARTNAGYDQRAHRESLRGFFAQVAQAVQ